MGALGSRTAARQCAMKSTTAIGEMGELSTPAAKRRPRIFWAKAIVTIAILGFLLWRIDLEQFAQAIKASLGPWLLLAFVAKSLALFISTYKWDRLLRALGIATSIWGLFELYTIGLFISSFLPGTVGGDVVRWQMAGKRTASSLKVAATILAERVTGVIALVVVCVPVVLIAVPAFAVAPVLTLSGAMASALLGGLALTLNRRLATTLIYKTRRLSIGRVVGPLYKLQKTLRSFPKRAVLSALVYSVWFYLSGGLTFYLICRAFDVQVTFVEATAVQILICLLLLLPVTIGGLGLVQAGDVFLLGILGVGAAEAFGMSMVRLATYYAYSFIGGLLFIRWRAKPSREPMWTPTRAELDSGNRLSSSVSGSA